MLNATKGDRRISISGGAGSGKTLPAMEKAARFDTAGPSVLYICHNPYVAQSVADALIYTNARLRSSATCPSVQKIWTRVSSRATISTRVAKTS